MHFKKGFSRILAVFCVISFIFVQIAPEYAYGATVSDSGAYEEEVTSESADDSEDLTAEEDSKASSSEEVSDTSVESGTEEGSTDSTSDSTTDSSTDSTAVLSGDEDGTSTTSATDENSSETSSEDTGADVSTSDSTNDSTSDSTSDSTGDSTSDGSSEAAGTSTDSDTSSDSSASSTEGTSVDTTDVSSDSSTDEDSVASGSGSTGSTTASGSGSTSTTTASGSGSTNTTAASGTVSSNTESKTSATADTTSANKVSEDSASDNAAESKTVSADSISANSLSVNEVEKVSVEDRILFLEDKGSEEEAIAELPDTWSVTLEDGTKKDVDITWECKDDFDDEQYTSYVFQAKIDDEEVTDSLSEEDEESLTMEIYYEEEVKDAEEVAEIEGHESFDSQVPISFSFLSPNTLITEVESEQGTDVISESYASDYGYNIEDDSVIESNVTYAASSTNLSSTAYNIFQAISPESNSYVYSSLSSAEKTLYNKLDSWVTQYLYYGQIPTMLSSGQPVTAFLSGTDLTLTEAVEVCELYYFNNPQAFFLTSQYMGKYYSGNSGYVIAIAFLPYCDTASEMVSVAETIASNINSYASQLTSAGTDYYKAKAAHDIVANRVYYDSYSSTSSTWTNFVPGNIYYEQSLISVFYTSPYKTVCAGYSKSFTALMRIAGLEAFSITSDSHEWNKAYVNGKWYCVDVTWDDTNGGYDYFLKSDDTMSSGNGSHYWQSLWSGRAPSSSSDYDTSETVYTITYYLNGGTNSTLNPSSYTASSGTITLYSPTRSGYTFGGWYTESSFSNKISTISASAKKNYTLYAKWTANSSSSSSSSSSSGSSSSSSSSGSSGSSGSSDSSSSSGSSDSSGTTESSDSTDSSDSSDSSSSASVTTDKVTAFVTRLYRIALEREPDASGLEWWVAQLKSGAKTGADVVSGFYMSDELLSRGYDNSKVVELAYNGIMGRASDADGKNYWVSILDSGASYQCVVCGFVTSTEFASLCSQYGITQGSTSVTENRDVNVGITKFVSRLYTCALGRGYDIDGLNYWCGIINNNTSRSNVLSVALDGFLHSTEFYSRGLSNGDYVTTLYRTFLGREPEAKGYYYWVLRLSLGESRDDVASEFAYSEEFSSIMSAYGL